MAYRCWQGCLFMMIVLAAGSESWSETRLTWQPQLEETVRQKMTHIMRVDAPIPGKKELFTTKIEQSWVQDADVENVTDQGDIELNLRFSQLAMSLSLPPQIGKSVEVNSDDPDQTDNPTEKRLSQTITKLIKDEMSWRASFNRLGVIQKVTLSDELKGLLAEDQTVQLLADALSESGLQRVLEQIIISLPDQPVEQGDQWEQVLSQPLGKGELTTRRICRYVGVDDEGLERIAVTMTSTFQPPAESQFPTELIKNSGRGEVLFDPARGRIVRSELIQNLELRVGYKERSITQTMEIRSKVEPAPKSLAPPKPKLDDKE